MSRAASAIAANQTIVRCLSAADWATLAGKIGGGPFGDSYMRTGGYTSTSSLRISISPDVCRLVALFTYKRYFPTSSHDRFDLSQAFAILTHEVANVHLDAAGTQTDATAECDGEQWIVPLAHRLRSSVRPATARMLATFAWRYRYPQLPASYRSPDCHNGGPLDLNPSSNVWP